MPQDRLKLVACHWSPLEGIETILIESCCGQRQGNRVCRHVSSFQLQNHNGFPQICASKIRSASVLMMQNWSLEWTRDLHRASLSGSVYLLFFSDYSAVCSLNVYHSSSTWEMHTCGDLTPSCRGRSAIVIGFLALHGYFTSSPDKRLEILCHSGSLWMDTLIAVAHLAPLRPLCKDTFAIKPKHSASKFWGESWEEYMLVVATEPSFRHNCCGLILTGSVAVQPWVTRSHFTQPQASSTAMVLTLLNAAPL